MVPAFWTGLAFWLLFFIAPLRGLLGLVPRLRSTSTGGRPWGEVLGGGKRGGADDAYMPEASRGGRNEQLGAGAEGAPHCISAVHDPLRLLCHGALLPHLALLVAC